MKLTARGWSRDMGENTLADYDLREVQARGDPNQRLLRSSPRMFESFGEVALHWVQRLRYAGEYRMELTFNRSDIVQLFKSAFGSELNVELLEQHGFTVSPELQKLLLIRLGDLVTARAEEDAAPAKEENAAPAKQEKQVEPEVPQVRQFPFRRWF